MAEARCLPGYRVMGGGGGQISSKMGAPPSGLFDFNAQDVADNGIVASIDDHLDDSKHYWDTKR
jgi:hypothetical protein